MILYLPLFEKVVNERDQERLIFLERKVAENHQYNTPPTMKQVMKSAQKSKEPDQETGIWKKVNGKYSTGKGRSILQ